MQQCAGTASTAPCGRFWLLIFFPLPQSKPQQPQRVHLSLCQRCLWHKTTLLDACTECTERTAAKLAPSWAWSTQLPLSLPPCSRRTKFPYPEETSGTLHVILFCSMETNTSVDRNHKMLKRSDTVMILSEFSVQMEWKKNENSRGNGLFHSNFWLTC